MVFRRALNLRFVLIVLFSRFVCMNCSILSRLQLGRNSSTLCTAGIYHSYHINHDLICLYIIFFLSCIFHILVTCKGHLRRRGRGSVQVFLHVWNHTSLQPGNALNIKKYDIFYHYHLILLLTHVLMFLDFDKSYLYKKVKMCFQKAPKITKNLMF